MDKYYYLAAQLPFLRFGVPSSFTRKMFLSEAAKWMGEKELMTFMHAGINELVPTRGEPSVLREFKVFERNLREELSEWRKAQKSGGEYRLPPALRAFVSEGNPLEIEKKLLHARWKFLEEKESEHYFDLEFLVIYFLKLQLLERMFTFDKEKGTQMFDSVCEVKYG